MEENIQEIVTHEWVEHQMKRNRVSVADIANLTGINYRALYQHIRTGEDAPKKGLSKPMKAMLWLVFKHEYKLGA